MDAATNLPALRINRLLPYWAVFQADFKQTANSWIYRFWVLLSMGAAIGYLLYRYGAMQESGMNQPAPETLGDLLRWAAFGSTTLVVVLTAGAICAAVIRPPAATITKTRYIIQKIGLRSVCGGVKSIFVCGRFSCFFWAGNTCVGLRRKNASTNTTTP